ncbi:MAG: response regulator [Parcubacteria group bacterium]|jgi:CheY-like chemotaxis protein
MANDKERKILIVDDEEDMREILSDKFGTSGFSVALAKDGAEGLEKALEIHPLVILLDIAMPNMDGLEMLEKLRHDAWGNNVPVILLTNISDMHKIEEAKKLGIQEYMLKAEWKMAQIIERVKEIVSD